MFLRFMGLWLYSNVILSKLCVTTSSVRYLSYLLEGFNRMLRGFLNSCYQRTAVDNGCVPIFTANIENLYFTSRALQIFNTDSEYGNAANIFEFTFFVCFSFPFFLLFFCLYNFFYLHINRLFEIMHLQVL